MKLRVSLVACLSCVPVIVVAGLTAIYNYKDVEKQATFTETYEELATSSHIDDILKQLKSGLKSASVTSTKLTESFDCHENLSEIFDFNRRQLQALLIRTPFLSIVCDEGPISPEFKKRAVLPVQPGLTFVGFNPTQLAILAAYQPQSPAQQNTVFAIIKPQAFVPLSDDHIDPISSWLLSPDGHLAPLAMDNSLPPPDITISQSAYSADIFTPSVAIHSTNAKYSYHKFSLPNNYAIVTGIDRLHDTGSRALLIHRSIQIIVVMLGGCLAIIAGADFIIARPLRHITREVNQWRESGQFNADAVHNAPAELDVLASSFQAATQSLSAQGVQLRNAVVQQDLLMQEIHHRVKNNLQIIASLLNLQAARIRQPEARAEFQSARDRVRALATLHRHLYAYGEVHTINMRKFLVELCGQLFQAMGEVEGERICLDIEASELQVSSDQAVPLALIVTEAVSNAIKYAFPNDRQGHISIRLAVEGDQAVLRIQDDGIGIPAGRADTDAGPRDGIGLQLIRGFARQLGATLSVHEEGGTFYDVIMPLQTMRVESDLI